LGSAVILLLLAKGDALLYPLDSALMFLLLFKEEMRRIVPSLLNTACVED
jgi:hypothetical protein